MAKGQIITVPSGTQRLITTQGRSEKQAFALLNPNDGVCYLALNRAADSNPSGWDWKLPSQSYGMFPGPWESLGIYFLDQSGAGRQGELNLYDSDIRLEIPDIHSIGRALQAQATALDITEGAQPANPGVGALRLWATPATEKLELLRSGGVNAEVIDTATALGGILAGTLPNPGFAAGWPVAGIGAGQITAAMLAAGAALSNLAVRSISNVSVTGFNAALSTTSSSFAPTADSVNYTAPTGSICLAFYMGTFYNSIAAAVDSHFLGVGGSNTIMAPAINAPNASYLYEGVFPAYWAGNGASQTIALYLACNTGTLTRNVGSIIIVELDR